MSELSLNSLKNTKANTGHTHTTLEITGLSTVATSGNYNDLINKPTSLPANGGTSQASNQLNIGGTATTFNWSGQSGQPTWLWGGNTQGSMYVYNPSNFNVNYANSAGSVPWSGVTGVPSSLAGGSLVYEYTVPTTTSDISITDLDVVGWKGIQINLTIPANSAAANYINLFANGDTNRANYSGWLDTVGNANGVCYVGFRDINVPMYLTLDMTIVGTAPGVAMAHGRVYRGYNAARLMQCGWSTMSSVSNVTSLIFRCLAGDLVTTIPGFVAGTTIRVFRKY